MLTELLNPTNQISFNFKLANKIGLHEAIVFNLLLQYMTSDSTSDSRLYVPLSQISFKSTLTKDEVISCYQRLQEANLLEIKTEDKYPEYFSINIDMLIGIFTTSDKEVAEGLEKIKKAGKKKNKNTYILKNVKSNISSNYPYIVKKSLENWVDGVYTKFGFVNNALITNNLTLINNLISEDIDKAVDIFNICASNGYREIEWGINKYNSLKKVKTVTNVGVTTSNTPLSNDFF